MKVDDPHTTPLQQHMEYLLKLGEVRATQVVATVGGIQGRANQEDTVDMIYLPISMVHGILFMLQTIHEFNRVSDSVQTK